MNNIVIGVLLLLLFTYCGGSSVPPFLKDNKKYLLGFAAGLAGYPLMRIEGAESGDTWCSKNAGTSLFCKITDNKSW
tara:strand:- start:3122 stop:3352 length:231 start_codon:yes stop_codon:yes gene_type:complete